MGQFAVLIVPPATDMAQVESVRRRFDPLAEAVPAHVTLVFPFEHEVIDGALVGHVDDVARGTLAFDLAMTALTCSRDHFLFLVVDQGAHQVKDLHDRLYTGLLRPLLSDLEFTPHVTLGRFDTADQCAAAMSAIEPMNIRVRTRAMSLRIYDLNRMPYQVAYELRFS